MRLTYKEKKEAKGMGFGEIIGGIVVFGLFYLYAVILLSC